VTTASQHLGRDHCISTPRATRNMCNAKQLLQLQTSTKTCKLNVHLYATLIFLYFLSFSALKSPKGWSEAVCYFCSVCACVNVCVQGCMCVPWQRRDVCVRQDNERGQKEELRLKKSKKKKSHWKSKILDKKNKSWGSLGAIYYNIYSWNWAIYYTTYSWNWKPSQFIKAWLLW
jgi:hypothetical protein